MAYQKLQVWTRTTGWDDEIETIYKLPNGEEYTGQLYGEINEETGEQNDSAQ